MRMDWTSTIESKKCSGKNMGNMPGKWDDPIRREQLFEFESIVKDWHGIEFEFPRRYWSSHDNIEHNTELFGFSDASESGLGFATYLRKRSGHILETGLIFARSLVVPTSLRPKASKSRTPEELTIPRLELQALYLLTKAVDQICEQFQLPIDSVQLWTDSSVVIQWLKSTDLKNVFVRNRVKLIRKNQVKHVITSSNPADIASRGVEPRILQTCDLWWHGPEWLKLPTDQSPTPEFQYSPGEEISHSTDASPFYSVECGAAIAHAHPVREFDLNNQLLNLSKLSSLTKAKRILAFTIRF